VYEGKKESGVIYIYIYNYGFFKTTEKGLEKMMDESQAPQEKFLSYPARRALPFAPKERTYMQLLQG
jgi:hypothetical protein